MTQLQAMITRFARDVRGATSIEYGLIIALIFLAILGGVTALSENTNESLNDTSAAITGAGG